MGLMTVSMEDFHIINCVSDVLKMFELELEQKDIALALEIGPPLVENPFIFADPVRISQIIINRKSFDT
jgi:signal transduction histidine kinase